MNVRVKPFELEGCACKIKFDPKELRGRLAQGLQEKFEKSNGVSLVREETEGEVLVTGRFLRIDDGNFALHFMLAFIGKPSVECAVKAMRDGRLLFEETVRTSPKGTCFHSMRALLKLAVDKMADKIVKQVVKAS